MLGHSEETISKQVHLTPNILTDQNAVQTTPVSSIVHTGTIAAYYASESESPVLPATISPTAEGLFIASVKPPCDTSQTVEQEGLTRVRYVLLVMVRERQWREPIEVRQPPLVPGESCFVVGIVGAGAVVAPARHALANGNETEGRDRAATARIPKPGFCQLLIAGRLVRVQGGDLSALGTPEVEEKTVEDSSCHRPAETATKHTVSHTESEPDR